MKGNTSSPTAHAMAGVLGPGFEVQHSRGINLSSARGHEDWWDVVLLDLRPAGLQVVALFNYFTRLADALGVEPEDFMLPH